MTVHQGDLYLGANVGTSLGSPADYIARWDGSTWSRVGSQGTDDWVRDLLSVGSDLYAGGRFVSAGGAPASHVARWDGTNWHAMGDGLNGEVRALTEYNGQIVAGGSFTASGTTSLTGVAAWDGTSWQALGDSLSPPEGGSTARIYDLAVYDGTLFATGSFSTLGGIGVAWLNGDRWRALSGGFVSGWAQSLTVAGGKLYVGGAFHYVGHNSLNADLVASWDGSSWGTLAAGVTDGHEVYKVAGFSDTVFVGGNFSRVDNLSAPSFAAWNGSYWDNQYSNYGQGLDGNVYAFLSDNNRGVVVGGGFTYAGGLNTTGIVRWDGAWHAYGDGLAGTVYDMTWFKGDLVAAGFFHYSGTTPVNFIASWDGTSWQPLGEGTSQYIKDLAVYDGDLIAAGFFKVAGVDSAGLIAGWDGEAWYPLGEGLTGGRNSPLKLTVYDGKLIVGGAFDHAGGIVARGLAQWDGTSWGLVGGGLDSVSFQPSVRALTVFDGDLYVAGYFEQAGGVPMDNIGRWDGTTWSAMGSVPSNVPFLTNYSGVLLAGLEAWNGSEWYTYVDTAPAAGGVGSAMEYDGRLDPGFSPGGLHGLFLGGNFDYLGGVATSKIALYDPVWQRTGVGEPEEPEAAPRFSAFPNPFRRSLTVRFDLETPVDVNVAVFDLAGRRVTVLRDEVLPAGTYEAAWDARDTRGRKVRPGVYFIRVRRGDQVAARRAVYLE
jgi:hypothetical protein